MNRSGEGAVVQFCEQRGITLSHAQQLLADLVPDLLRGYCSELEEQRVLNGREMALSGVPQMEITDAHRQSFLAQQAIRQAAGVLVDFAPSDDQILRATVKQMPAERPQIFLSAGAA